jgi:hypothetical protein
VCRVPFAGNIYTVYTDNDYRYNYGWILPIRNHLAFKVRTCSDAHVLLSSSLDMTGTTSYEIVLGGYNNLYSDIRRGLQGSILTQAYTPNIMNCNELLPVWIQWENQILEVGVGPLGAHTILRLDEPEVSSIQSASVTSWYDARGEYRFLESQGKYLLNYSISGFTMRSNGGFLNPTQGRWNNVTNGFSDPDFVRIVKWNFSSISYC